MNDKHAEVVGHDMLNKYFGRTSLSSITEISKKETCFVELLHHMTICC